MKRERLFFLLTLAALLTMLIVSYVMAGRTAVEEPLRRQVSVIVDNSSAGRWKPFFAGLEQAAEENNISLSVVTTAGIGGEEGMSLAENEIANGASGLVLQPWSMEMLEAAAALGRRTSVELVDVPVFLPEADSVNLAGVFGREEELGQALGEALEGMLPAEKKSLDVGILRGRSFSAAATRMKGLEEELNRAGFRIRWILESGGEMPEKLEGLQKDTPVEAVVALENDSLEMAAEWKQESGSGVILLGAGNSDKNIYYLDKGVIALMAVPDAYSMGYLALTEIAEHLNNRLTPMENREIGFVTVTRENLFSKDKERLLFPMIQ